MAEWVFWICVALVGHTYLLYPCFLFLAYAVSQIRRDLTYLGGTQDRRQAHLADDELPNVSLVIPAFNEERGLPRKLSNLDSLDYPSEKLDIVFVSDGSTDGTNEILGGVDQRNVRVAHFGGAVWQADSA